MAKSAKRNTDDSVTLAPEPSIKSDPTRAGQATKGDVARRAYDLYLAHGCEHGNDVQDWFQAERELAGRRGVSSRGAR